VTVTITVAAWPAVVRLTKNVVAGAAGETGTLKLPVPAKTPPASTVALVVLVNWSELSRLLGVHAASRAVTVT
jgi:hypothetical protein